MGVMDTCFELRTTVVRMFDSVVIDHCKGLNSAGLKLYDNATMIAELVALTNLTGFVTFILFFSEFFRFLDEFHRM